MTDLLISIHAPAWGATSNSLVDNSTDKDFNPRTRVGCDRFIDNTSLTRAQISIHAPAWGATALTEAQKRANAFQSTHPRGVRR